jgi:predicted nucleotidyltransferase
MTLRQLIEQKREDIVSIAARHGARNVRLFGSVARGEDTPDSDVDLLVDVGPTTSSWFPAGLVLDIEEVLGRPVEIVTEKGLNPLIKDQVLQEAVPL